MRRWDDGLALFDRLSGATHCLSSVAAVVFERMSADPSLGDDSLVLAVSACTPEASGPERLAAVAEARIHLAKAGLIEP